MIPDASTILRAKALALKSTSFPSLGEPHRGKVRDNYVIGDRRILIATDRLSAFDRVVGCIPYKGQVLNQLSSFWFEAIADVAPSHMLDTPDPNVMLAKEGEPFPVEIIVRGYITGVTTTSLWYNYERGEREMYGLRLPDGLRKNQALPEPVITPTTRATGIGGHDERITPAEILERGVLTPDEWDEISSMALAIFSRGQQIAAQAGIILVDTKYEFARVDGRIALIDEVHTPDSSRFWKADTYQQRFAAGQEPENFDKELVRLWFAEQGYRGDGDPPPLSDDIIVRLSQRYISIFEMLTRQEFSPASYPAEPRIEAALERIGVL